MKTILTLGFACLGLVLSTLTMAKVSFNVMAYNIFQLQAPDWDQRQRAYRLDTAIRRLDPAPDVIVFNEVFSGASVEALKGLLDIYPYQTENVGQSCYSGWDKITGPCSLAPFIEKGGVVTISKYPILYSHAHVYRSSYRNSWDYFANKGFAYTVIEKSGKKFHVFGTHLQATHDDVPDDEHDIRMNQLSEMKKIVDGYDIPKDEAVIFAGDMNVEWTQSNQVKDMLATLNANLQYQPNGIHSYSSKENWLTKLYYRRFGGDDSFNDTLDYVMISQDHLQPSQPSPQKILMLRTGLEWYWNTMQGHWELPEGEMEHSGFYDELSDHFPVQAQFEFDE